MAHREVTPWAPSRRATARVLDPLPVPTHCHHCGGECSIVSNAEIYGTEYGQWPWAVLCKGCKAYVGLHPFTGIPLGTLANEAERSARKLTKPIFNAIWQHGHMERTQAYAWLVREMGLTRAQCHIGMFTVEQCAQVRLLARSFFAHLSASGAGSLNGRNIESEAL